MNNHESLVAYYSRRAPEYDSIWRRDDPDRQAEQHAMADAIRGLIRERSVLEVACGTGYWTQFAAETARQILAVDVAPEMLKEARTRSWPEDNVTFLEFDAYQLERLNGEFDAGLTAFWFSHVPRSRVAEFLDGFHRRLSPGSPVFLADNRLVPGVGGELVAVSNSNDTFKRRTLADGSEHLVLKNYYSEQELEFIFRAWNPSLEIHVGRCFWWVAYRV